MPSLALSARNWAGADEFRFDCRASAGRESLDVFRDCVSKDPENTFAIGGAYDCDCSSLESNGESDANVLILL